MESKKKDKYFVCGGKRYIIDMNRLTEIFCNKSDMASVEREITDALNLDEEKNQMVLTSRINREVKSSDEQNSKNMVLFEVFKLLLLRIFDNDLLISGKAMFEYDFPTALALNTLINWEIIKEVNNE